MRYEFICPVVQLANLSQGINFLFKIFNGFQLKTTFKIFLKYMVIYLLLLLVFIFMHFKHMGIALFLV